MHHVSFHAAPAIADCRVTRLSEDLPDARLPESRLGSLTSSAQQVRQGRAICVNIVAWNAPGIIMTCAMDGPSLFPARDLWKTSVFSYEPDKDLSIFEDLTQQPLPPLLPLEQQQQDLFNVGENLFTLPPLEFDDTAIDAQDGPFSQQGTAAVRDERPPTEPEAPAEDDVWDLEVGSALVIPSRPTLYTWEAFQLRDDELPVPKYLSELGPGAFDAYIQRHEKNQGVLPQEVILRACSSLILGRSSLFFQWDAESRFFSRTLSKTPLSGLSLACSDSVLERFMDFGTRSRRLSEYASVIETSQCHSLVALRRCVGTVLESVDMHLSAQVQSARSFLALQHAIDRPTQVLELLSSLVDTSFRSATDEDLIADLSDLLTTFAESGSHLTSLLQQMLARVSAPWLEKLADEVGLVGKGSSLRSWTDESPAVLSDHDAADERRPRFVAVDDWHLIEDTKQSIKVLAKHLPVLTLPQTRVEAPSIYSNPSQPDLSDAFELPALVLDTSGGEDGTHTLQLDPLQESLGSVIDTLCGTDTEGVAGYTNDILAPMRQDLIDWSHVISAKVMSHVFETNRLRDHLDLHRSFHLCGSGDFVGRLTTALFSGETQSAERTRGNLPTGKTMGLRLESREGQRWPPASSELRLTLLGVLTDAHGNRSGESELPGLLSFAIRELSEAEIDKVMDPTSIHALDFLRLQHTSPVALADIFTPGIVQKFDDIFRVLLVYVRLLHTTQQLSWHCNIRTADRSTTAARRFAWKARHLITAMSSHLMDAGIDESWRRFMASLADLDPTQIGSDTYVGNAKRPATHGGIAEITRMLTACLVEIRGSMFLRRKQDAIRATLEEALDAILKGAAAVMYDPARGYETQRHETRMDEAISRLIRLVVDVARKPGKNADAQRESDNAKLLLQRLAWNYEGIEDAEIA